MSGAPLYTTEAYRPKVEIGREEAPPPPDPDYAPPGEPIDARGGPAASLLTWYDDGETEPPAYLVRDTLPETGIGVVAGQYGTGKTFAGADLAAAVMTGNNFAGEPVMRRGAVLWFASEGEGEIKRRVRAAVESKYGATDSQPFARQARDVPKLTELDALQKLNTHAEEAAKRAREKFGLPLALIVVDTLSAAAGFDDENSASETQKVLNVLRALSRATKALVLLIDHYGKMTETGIRGSSAKGAAADAVLACLGERNAEGAISNRRLAVVKLRDGPTGRVIPFDLRIVQSDFGTTCTVEWRPTEPAEVKPAEKAKRLSTSLVMFKRALENAIGAAGQRIRPFPDGPEVLAARRDAVRAEFLKIYPADDRKAKGEAFRRCEKDAIAAHLMTAREIGPAEKAETFFWTVSK